MSPEALLDLIDTKLHGLTVQFPMLQKQIWAGHKHVRYALQNVDTVDPKPVLLRTARWMLKEGNKRPAFRQTMKPLIETTGKVLGIDAPAAAR